jgi:Tfp pilus assembly protein PilP
MYAFVLGSMLLLSGCSAEIGSEQWCAEMKEKPKGEWTANEATDYAKHCLLK